MKCPATGLTGCLPVAGHDSGLDRQQIFLRAVTHSPLDQHLLGLGAVGEAAGQSHRLQRGHAALVGVASRPVDLADDGGQCR